MIDLLIAGAGPAGLATAIRGAMAGLETVVVEPQAGVIDKACGEGLMPPALAALERMEVVVRGHPFVGIRYVDGERQVEARFREGPGRGVRRTVLHQGLLDRASSLGVRRLTGTVSAVHQDAERVQVSVTTPLGSTTEVASYMVVADGLHSKLRRRLGLRARPHHPPRYGIRRHYAMSPWSEFVEVHWSPRAEAYVTPVASDSVGVAVVFRGKGSFNEWLRQFPQLHQRLTGHAHGSSLGGGPFEQRVRGRVAGRILLVGDAAGFLDPMTGEGLRLGLMGAEQLIGCLRAGRPQNYEVAWKRLTAHYWRLTDTMLWLGRWPVARRSTVPLLQRCPRLMDWGLRYLLA